MSGTIRYIYLYRCVPGAQKIPQGVAGRITWLLIISTELAWVEEWHKTKNFKFELLTDFSLLELQVLPRQGLPGIVDVQQLDELPGHRVGQLVDELGRPLASRVACFAWHQICKTNTYILIYPQSLIKLPNDQQIFKFTIKMKISSKWCWQDDNCFACGIENPGHAPMSSRDSLTMFTLSPVLLAT